MNVPILDLKPAYLELAEGFDAAYRRVMASGRFLFGPELEAFEAEYASSVGVAHCVGVGNGLEALQMVLMAKGIGPGDEVIVPSNGYIATWFAVTHVGARPVPCEPDESTHNLDPKRVAALITPRTKTILPIHLYGQTADMTALMELAAGRGLLVLEDAAQSHGAKCRGRAERQPRARGGGQLLAQQESRRVCRRRRRDHERRRLGRQDAPSAQLRREGTVSKRGDRPQFPPG